MIELPLQDPREYTKILRDPYTTMSQFRTKFFPSYCRHMSNAFET